MEIEKNKQESTLIWTDRGRLVLGNLGEYHEALYGLFGPLKSQTHLVAESVQAVRAKFVSEGAQLEGRIHALLPPPCTRNENEFSREGYLFRKRQKGIGAPWKRIYASLSINYQQINLRIIGPDGVFSQQSLHTKQRGLVEQVPNSSVNVLICQVPIFTFMLYRCEFKRVRRGVAVLKSARLTTARWCSRRRRRMTCWRGSACSRMPRTMQCRIRRTSQHHPQK